MTDRRPLVAAALFLLLVGAKILAPEVAERVLPPLQEAIDRDSLALPMEAMEWLAWR